MTWYLTNPERLSLERETIQILLTTTDWLRSAEWSFDAVMCLGVNAVIRVHGYEYSVRLRYPQLYPNVPPEVLPSNPQVRWSGHQYADGTLCLEWGPDTWYPEITGAQVLESAHRLLELENPLGEDGASRVAAPSRHALSTGQALRRKYLRCYAGLEIQHFLASLPKNSKWAAKIVCYPQSQSFLFLIQQIRSLDIETALYSDTSMPAKFDHGITTSGLVYTPHLSPEAIDAIITRQHLEQMLCDTGLISQPLQDEFARLFPNESCPFPCVLIVDSVNHLHFFFTFDWQDDGWHRAEIIMAEGEVTSLRLPERLHLLKDRSVAVLGTGSVGSKVTVSLARMGVSRFYLIDEDILRPENLARHILDWRNVCEHKVDGLVQTLLFINPKIETEVSYLNLTGQESTQALSTALGKLARYDLIIDATANPGVFNLATAAATTYSKPMAWAEVFAGGIGGLVARSRPNRDPSPQTMRAAWLEFATQHPFSGPSSMIDYTAQDDQGHVLAASDADVAVIADHLARFAADTLTESEVVPSFFPYSMYLVGLTPSWVFEAPFHTIPISTEHLVQVKAGSDDQGALASDLGSKSCNELAPAYY